MCVKYVKGIDGRTYIPRTGGGGVGPALRSTGSHGLLMTPFNIPPLVALQSHMTPSSPLGLEWSAKGFTSMEVAPLAATQLHHIPQQ